jgi:hypothetical protein
LTSRHEIKAANFIKFHCITFHSRHVHGIHPQSQSKCKVFSSSSKNSYKYEKNIELLGIESENICYDDDVVLDDCHLLTLTLTATASDHQHIEFTKKKGKVF